MLDQKYITPQMAAFAIRSIILFFPDSHDQENWIDSQHSTVRSLIEGVNDPYSYCGSTACVAGWAHIITSRFNSSIQITRGGADAIRLSGKTALGIDEWESYWLFGGERSKAEVLVALDLIIKGESLNDLRMGYKYASDYPGYEEYERMFSRLPQEEDEDDDDELYSDYDNDEPPF